MYPHSLPWMRYYLWGLQIKKGTSQEDPGRSQEDGQRYLSGPETEVQRATKIRGEKPPGFWIYKTCSLFQPSPQDLRLCASRWKWDRGKTNSVSGCKMSSKNFCRSRKRSCWRSRDARGFGSMSAPGGRRRSYGIERQCSGVLSLGSPTAASS